MSGPASVRRCGWWLVLGAAAGSGCQLVLGIDQRDLVASAQGGSSGQSGQGGASAQGGAGSGGAAGGQGGAGSAGSAGEAGAGQGGEAGASGEAGAAGTSGGPCGGKSAPEGKRKRAMAAVAGPGGACLWVDTLEVTWDDYQAFLDGGFKPEDQALVCKSNDSFAPSGCGYAGKVPDGQGAFPVACVDWCDAAAYCAWDGKRLCKAQNPSIKQSSEWYQACSGGDARQLPYGLTPDAAACTTKDNPSSPCSKGTCASVEAGSAPTCATPEGLLDLVGNVAEWVDECNSTSFDGLCAARGGSYAEDSSALNCERSDKLPRATVDPKVGFRCCAD